MSECNTSTKRNRKFKSRSKAPLVSTCKACGNDYRPINANHSAFCCRECKAWHHNHSHKYAYGPLSQPLPARLLNAVNVVDKCKCCDSYVKATDRNASFVLCHKHKDVPFSTKLMFWRGVSIIKCCVCSSEFCRMPGSGRGPMNTCGSEECKNKRERLIRKTGKRKSKALRRARKKGLESVSIDPIKVFERDNWICHICKRKTRKDMRGSTHPRAPELEHIVSLADNGSHTWGNVACSCRECNASKGSKSYGQMHINIPI